MSKNMTFTVQTPEPIVLPVEEFESRTDRERRIFTVSGGDVATFILQFLRGNRKADIGLDELRGTQLFARSNDAERRALRLVCADHLQIPASADDALKLRARDVALIDFTEGRHVRGDWSAQLRGIPALLRQRKEFDARTFDKQWEAPRLFNWVFLGGVE